MKLDQAADVERVGLAKIGAHVVADLLKRIADLFDLLSGEPCKRMVWIEGAAAPLSGARPLWVAPFCEPSISVIPRLPSRGRSRRAPRAR